MKCIILCVISVLFIRANFALPVLRFEVNEADLPKVLRENLTRKLEDTVNVLASLDFEIMKVMPREVND